MENITAQKEEFTDADIALNKKVLEYCNHSHFLTAPSHEPYNDLTNYCATHWPGYITVDLEKSFSVRQISFQLWDYKDPNNLLSSQPKVTKQMYAYRLLCSDDKKNWSVIYDTADTKQKYRRGWQTFKLTAPLNARYIRIHAVHNKRNSGFHVVRLHVFQQENKLYDDNGIILCVGPFEQESGDGYPISYQLLDLSGRIQNIISVKANQTDENGKLIEMDANLKKEYTEVVDYLFEKSTELDAITGKIDEIRKIITQPVSEKLKNVFVGFNKERTFDIYFQLISTLVWIVIQLGILINFRSIFY